MTTALIAPDVAPATGSLSPSVSTTNLATCGELTPGVLTTSMPSSFAASMSMEPRLVPRRTSTSGSSRRQQFRQASINCLETVCAETTRVVGRSGTSAPWKKSAVGEASGKTSSLAPVEAAVADLNV